MQHSPLPPDDPRLTAYALGELEGDERAAVEAALRQDARLRETVEEIRAAAGQIEEALAAEPAPSVFSTPPMEVSRRHEPVAAIVPERDLSRSRQGAGDSRGRGQVLRFPRAIFGLAGLAAACLAILFFAGRQAPTPGAKPAAPTPTPGPVAATETKVNASVAVTAIAPPADGQAAPAESVVAVAQTVPTPVALEALVPSSAKPDPLSLLGQARNADELAGRVGPLARGPQPNQTKSEAPSTRTVEFARAEPAGLGANAGRTYIYPGDEKMVITAVPSTEAADRKSVVVAEPKPRVILPATRPVPADPGATGSSASPLLLPSSGRLVLGPTPGDSVVVSSTPGAVTAPPPSSASVTTDAQPANVPSFVSDIPGSLTASAREALLRPLTLAPGAGLATGTRPTTDNNFISAAQSPVATVSIESETSSVSALRRFLQQKRLPPRETVRIEELVNYFPYHYPSPRGDAPFAASLEVADAPWSPAHRLVRIGLKAREAQIAPRAPVNLVFVLDVVDVERLPSRLPMIKEAIQSLVGKLRPDDRVALVSCHHDASLVLPPTAAAKSREIAGALDTFSAATGTSRMKGIQLAYDTLAAYGLSSHGRVILCTDGNAGLTITAEGPLARVIEAKAKAGVALTAFAFGMGIYRDSLIEFLADWGSGNYGYIDSRREAERMLAEDVNGPAVTIAKDVKVEVEFNPARVASYRLIGYENRVLGKDDFKAGALATNEVSAGHAVTALFEIVPADGRVAVGGNPVAGLRYQAPKNAALNLPLPGADELLTVKVRYKKPGGAIGRKLDLPLADARTRFVDASADFKFAAAVASFGMVLRDSPHKGAATLSHVIEWAESAALEDLDGNRAEFLELAREVQAIVR